MWWKPVSTARGTGLSFTLSELSPAVSSALTNRQTWITKWVREWARERANRLDKQKWSLCKQSSNILKGLKMIQLKKQPGYKRKRITNCWEFKISKPKRTYSTENLNLGWNRYFSKTLKRNKEKESLGWGEARRCWRQFNLSWNPWIE